MATYLKSIDPYNHLLTSSVSYQSMKFWTSKSLDFTQTHLYGPNNKILNLPTRAQDYISTYKKPYACGEMGASPAGNQRPQQRQTKTSRTCTTACGSA